MGGALKKAKTERRRIFHKVVSGDNVSKIAASYKIPFADLIKWNKQTLPNPNKIRVGQRLYIVSPYPGALGNPGNVVRGPVAKAGEDRSSTERFAKFTDPRDGLNAEAVGLSNIRRYLAKKGKDFTIDNMAHVYAPSFENDTEQYIKDISSFSGIPRGEVLDTANTGKMADLLKAIARRESGKDKSDWFTQDEYNEAAQWVGRDPSAETKAPPATSGKSVRQAAKGGDTGVEGPRDGEMENPTESAKPAPADISGPRIVINPDVFDDGRDAVCVAYNEAFRLIMEEMGFDPVSEPTDEQREFFAGTAYENNEEMLRRTIIARIATFDTSVKNPTQEQIEETIEFLGDVMKAGAPQNSDEQSAVKRIQTVLQKTLETPEGQKG